MQKKNKIRLIWIATCLALFIVLSVLTFADVVQSADDMFFNWAASVRSSGMTTFMRGTSLTVKAWFSLLVLFILVIIPHTRWFAFPAGLAAGIAFITRTLIKPIFGRSRPDVWDYVPNSAESYPSGHTLGATAFYFTIAILLFMLVKKHKWIIALIAFSFFMPLMIGISRVYLGAHFGTDVAASWILGTAIAFLAIMIWEFSEKTLAKFPKFARIHNFFFSKKYMCLGKEDLTPDHNNS